MDQVPKNTIIWVCVWLFALQSRHFHILTSPSIFHLVGGMRTHVRLNARGLAREAEGGREGEGEREGIFTF